MAWKTYEIKTRSQQVRTYEVRAQSPRHAINKVAQELEGKGSVELYNMVDIYEHDEEVTDW